MGKPNCPDKILSRVTLSKTNPTWTALGLNLGLCGKKLVVDHMNYGLAKALCTNVSIVDINPNFVAEKNSQSIPTCFRLPATCMVAAHPIILR